MYLHESSSWYVCRTSGSNNNENRHAHIECLFSYIIETNPERDGDICASSHLQGNETSLYFT